VPGAAEVVVDTCGRVLVVEMMTGLVVTAAADEVVEPVTGGGTLDVVTGVDMVDMEDVVLA
jgi:hypothetical protein